MPTVIVAVSIPFIAGQWSLPGGVRGACPVMMEFQSPSLRGSGRFLNRPSGEAYVGGVSIPFIAGQWSLLRRAWGASSHVSSFQSPSLRGSGRFESDAAALVERLRFQSPSLRGSGRFKRSSPTRMGSSPGFNPLHCGAVVASRVIRRLRRSTTSCFNPLHCGAVVASRRGRLRRRRPGRSFNPLHCGAVVASNPRSTVGTITEIYVSIPFIAGQWSLRRQFRCRCYC